MKKRTFKWLISWLLILSISLMGATNAFCALDGDEDVDDLITTFGWDGSLINAEEWAVAHAGVEYTARRESQYVEDYYEDILTTTKLYLGISESFGGSAIADVAIGELGAEGSIESPPGSNNVKYTQHFGMVGSAWCAMFVLWCAEQCGYIESGLFPTISSGAANCTVMYHFFVHQQGFESFDMRTCSVYGGSNGYTPEPGDIIFYTKGNSSSIYPCCLGMEHVGIVTEVTNNCVTTVEGNWGSRVSERNFYYPANARIVRVEYPAEDGEAGIFRYLYQKLDNRAAVCGILGAMQNETGGTFEADLWEQGFAQGYGLLQWTDSSYYGFYRRTQLFNWCEANGYDPSTTQGQLEFLCYDLAYQYSSTLDFILNVDETAQGAYLAGQRFGKYYMGGGTYTSASSYGNRVGNYAKTLFWPKYGSG